MRNGDDALRKCDSTNRYRVVTCPYTISTNLTPFSFVVVQPEISDHRQLIICHHWPHLLPFVWFVTDGDAVLPLPPATAAPNPLQHCHGAACVDKHYVFVCSTAHEVLKTGKKRLNPQQALILYSTLRSDVYMKTVLQLKLSSEKQLESSEQHIVGIR